MLSLETRNGWTSRAIDFQFHKFYWENRHVVPVEEHINHQYHMLEVIHGYEEEIFTDNVTYPFREHFNGPTGTLSNLLSNCFFHIYYAMLERGILVNVETDLKILYCIVYRFNNVPPIELHIVEKIRNRLITLLGTIPPFLSHAYYKKYYEFIERADTELLLPSSTCTYYKENPTDRTIQFIKSKLPYVSEFESIGEPLMYKFGPCEYVPDYIEIGMYEPLSKTVERLKKVELFFT